MKDRMTSQEKLSLLTGMACVRYDDLSKGNIGWAFFERFPNSNRCGGDILLSQRVFNIKKTIQLETLKDTLEILEDAIKNNRAIYRADRPVKLEMGFVILGNKYDTYYGTSVRKLYRSGETKKMNRYEKIRKTIMRTIGLF